MEIITIQKGIILVGNVILATEKLREELEALISLKGLNHEDVLKLSQRLDKYILMHYSEKY
ncbi:aspartyl-phosphate phosphatase Spo0E family protein [Clostridium estertheticum]|uniref:aspartyl-phosphate phosphatase Spo0E family protein n=1 Tax=Clostridium estertheticum TaxID=238834 RepID=UPI0013E98F93|nr:aspartyl-phosphate phosphatase Spo0E family protein [Clostridium estertheticum]MBZ9687045.1 aspartyl-phosphate phosphatase Spo0E family protein [Clostridium estertheticum]